MKKIAFILLLFVSFFSFGQGRLKLIMDTKPVGSTIRLSQYQGDLEIPLDSIRYRGESEVNFQYDNRFTDGVYLIDIGQLESFQFVLVEQENINGHIYPTDSGMAFKADQSKENDAFNIMLNLSRVYSQNMDTLALAMDHLSDFAPRHAAITDSLTTVYHRVADAYNNSLGLLNNLFPESYAAQVLVSLDKIPLRTQNENWNRTFDNDAAFNHVHYFSNVNFEDERIISNPFLSSKVLEYLYNYTEHSENGIHATIDKLLEIPNAHPKVQAFLIDLLVDFFTDKEATEFIEYINQQYLGSCDLPLSEETLKKIESAVVFNVGDQIPIVKIEGQTGLKIPVSTLNSQLNVIMFWASWCPHCVRELPKLKTLYDHMKGDLGVYAISVDTSKTDWIKTINDNDLNWVNVNDLKGWESQHLQTFGITSTPTLILLDEELRWIGRTSSFDGLHELVKQQLEP